MQGERGDVFDMIHAEMDALPPEDWTLSEARRVLALLRAFRRARNPIANIGCVATPGLRRLLGA